MKRLLVFVVFWLMAATARADQWVDITQFIRKDGTTQLTQDWSAGADRTLNIGAINLTGVTHDFGDSYQWITIDTSITGGFGWAQVENLSADMVDGKHAADFPQLYGGNSFTGAQSIDGLIRIGPTTFGGNAITQPYLSADLAGGLSIIAGAKSGTSGQLYISGNNGVGVTPKPVVIGQSTTGMAHAAQYYDLFTIGTIEALQGFWVGGSGWFTGPLRLGSDSSEIRDHQLGYGLSLVSKAHPSSVARYNLNLTTSPDVSGAYGGDIIIKPNNTATSKGVVIIGSESYTPDPALRLDYSTFLTGNAYVVGDIYAQHLASSGVMLKADANKMLVPASAGTDYPGLSYANIFTNLQTISYNGTQLQLKRASGDTTNGGGGTPWNLEVGQDGSYAGYLKFWRAGGGRTANDWDFAFTEAGIPIIRNHELDVSDGYTFGSSSSGALAWYMPFNGTDTGKLSFRTKGSAPYNGEFYIQAYSAMGGWHTEALTHYHATDSNGSGYIDNLVESRNAAGLQVTGFGTTYDYYNNPWPYSYHARPDLEVGYNDIEIITFGKDNDYNFGGTPLRMYWSSNDYAIHFEDYNNNPITLANVWTLGGSNDSYSYGGNGSLNTFFVGSGLFSYISHREGNPASGTLVYPYSNLWGGVGTSNLYIHSGQDYPFEIGVAAPASIASNDYTISKIGLTIGYSTEYKGFGTLYGYKSKDNSRVNYLQFTANSTAGSGSINVLAKTFYYDNASFIGNYASDIGAYVTSFGMSAGNIFQIGPNYRANIAGVERTYPVEFYYGKLNNATNGYLKFMQKNGAANTEVARFDHQGYLGINVTAPGYHLDVGGDINATGAYRFDGTTLVDTNGYITLKSSTDAAAPNGSLYYSSTQSKPVWKDAGGVVNNLY